MTAAPEAEAVRHPSAFAHGAAVLDLASVVVRVTPILVAIPRNDAVVGHGIRLGTPDIKIGGVIGGIGPDRVLGGAGPKAGGLHRGIDHGAEFFAGGIHLVDRAADELRPTLRLPLHLELAEELGDTLVEGRWRQRTDPPVAAAVSAGRRVAVDAGNDVVRGNRRSEE